MIRRWQNIWDREIIRHQLYSIQERVNVSGDMSLKREENIILTRLRIGHTKLNKILHIIGIF